MSFELHELIHSMSKSEKRYFKLTAQDSKETSYLILFDLIANQSVYNEIDLKKKIKGKIDLKNFPTHKNYLLNAVLKNLTSFHQEGSLSSKTSSSIYTIRLLLDKALYRQSFKLIQKSQKFAELSENFNLLLDIVNLKLVYYETIMDNDKVNDTFQEIFKIQDLSQNLESIRFLHHKMYELISSLGEFKRNQLEQKAKNILQNKLLLQEDNALSLEAKIRFNEIYFLYYYIQNDFIKAFSYSSRSVELSETSSYYQSEKRDNYISNLNNYLICCNSLNYFNLSEDVIKKLKSFVTNDKTSKTTISIFINSALQETNLILLKKEFFKINSLIGEYENKLKLFDSKIVLAHKYGLFINISVLYFINQDYKSALKWTNKVIQGIEPNTRTDVIGYSYLLNVMIHYELGNIDYLDHLIKSTKSYLAKKSQLEDTADLLFKFILQFSMADDKKKFQTENAGLIAQIESKKFSKDLDESGYFDIRSWVKSKWSGINLKDYLLKN